MALLRWLSLAGSGWCVDGFFGSIRQTSPPARHCRPHVYVVMLATMDCGAIDHNMRTFEVRPAMYGKSSAHLRQPLPTPGGHRTAVAASVKSATTNKVVVLDKHRPVGQGKSEHAQCRRSTAVGSSVTMRERPLAGQQGGAAINRVCHYCGCRPTRDRCARIVVHRNRRCRTRVCRVVGSVHHRLESRLGRHRAMRTGANSNGLYGGSQISQATIPIAGWSPQQQIDVADNMKTQVRVRGRNVLCSQGDALLGSLNRRSSRPTGGSG